MQDQQNIMAEQTSTTPVEQTDVQADPVQEAPQQEITYNKQQVIDMMKRRVARSHNAFFQRYGVKDLNELDNLFNEGKSIKDEYAKLQLANSELTRTNAFLKNNVNPDKYDDIIAYFKGKGLDFSEDALLQAIGTHPEWLKPSTIPNTTTIQSLGAEAHINPSVDESEIAAKLLGVKSL
jgi:hypothetical protein